MNLGVAPSAILKGSGSIRLESGLGVCISIQVLRRQFRKRYFTSTSVAAVMGISCVWSSHNSFRSAFVLLRGVEGPMAMGNCICTGEKGEH